MHTLNASNGTRFHYNSDMSGNVIVRARDIEGDNPIEVHIDGDDLTEFVAEYVSRRRISEIESMTTNEVLGIKEHDPDPPNQLPTLGRPVI